MIITSKITPLFPLMFITLSPDWTDTIKAKDAEINTDTTLPFPAVVRIWPLPFPMEINAVLFQWVKVEEWVWQTTCSVELVQRLVKPKERTNFSGPTYMKTTCCWLLAGGCWTPESSSCWNSCCPCRTSGCSSLCWAGACLAGCSVGCSNGVCACNLDSWGWSSVCWDGSGRAWTGIVYSYCKEKRQACY